MALATTWPPGQRGARHEKAFCDYGADVNPEHLVCGVAASLREWEPRQFSAFLAWADGGRDGGPLPPLRLDHERVMCRGAEPADAGTCLEFASAAPGGGFPGGLLVLAALHPDFAPSILRGMSSGQWMAMSVRGAEHGFAGEPGDLLVGEVSLVSRVGDQLDPGALIIGTGRDAAAAWELLACSRASRPASARAPDRGGNSHAARRGLRPAPALVTAGRG